MITWSPAGIIEVTPLLDQGGRVLGSSRTLCARLGCAVSSNHVAAIGGGIVAWYVAFQLSD